MVYVGKGGGSAPGEEDVRIPSQYSGNAFGADGEMRSFAQDADAFRHAEDLFRRGYVFEDRAVHTENEIGEGDDTGAPAPENRAAEAVMSAARSAPPPDGGVRRDASGKKAPGTEKRAAPGGIFGLISTISTEEILIGTLILMLYLNGADDELLIMLAILLFC